MWRRSDLVVGSQAYIRLPAHCDLTWRAGFIAEFAPPKAGLRAMAEASIDEGVDDRHVTVMTVHYVHAVIHLEMIHPASSWSDS